MAARTIEAISVRPSNLATSTDGTPRQCSRRRNRLDVSRGTDLWRGRPTPAQRKTLQCASPAHLVYPRRMHPGGPPGHPHGLPQIGQRLAGKYEIVRLLGEGGMAFVFEANHKRLQQRVAI